MFGAGGGKRKPSEARARAERVRDQVGLKHRSTHLAADLTLPDLKRLELAKELAMDPELLFLDEVMAGLNPTEVWRAMQLLQTINSCGITLFATQHQM